MQQFEWKRVPHRLLASTATDGRIGYPFTNFHGQAMTDLKATRLYIDAIIERETKHGRPLRIVSSNGLHYSWMGAGFI